MVLLSTSFTVQFNFSLSFYMEVNMAIGMLNVFQSVWFEVASLWGFRPTAARGRDLPIRPLRPRADAPHQFHRSMSTFQFSITSS